MSTTKKMWTGTLVTVMTSWKNQQTQLVTPTDDPELLEQFDGNLDADASQVYAPASRSFHEARELLLSCVQSGSGYFPVVGTGAFDGLAQPSTDRKPAKLRGNGKKGKRNGKTSSYKVECFQALVHVESCQNTDLTPRTSSTDVQETSDRNWHHSWWTTSSSSG